MAESNDRSLEGLGLADTPALDPLCYPGRPLTFPGLLRGNDLFAITAGDPDVAVGEWMVDVGGGRRVPLDTALAVLGDERMRERIPVLAIGSHASPGQVRQKLRDSGLSTAVPLTPARVHGIRIGFSGHVSPAGYVAASPYTRLGAVVDLVVTWLDARQLKAFDDTEYPEYRRVVFDEQFLVQLGDGAPLFGVHLYVNALGVLACPDGRTPTPLMPQREILTMLCARSPRIADQFGGSPEEFVRRARADPALRAVGTRHIAEEGWLLPQPALDALPDARILGSSA
ncbi:hypothetical protein GCM10023205_53700 [Yinghuangia aomiensis]|uniref:Uncharacterized protein n=1 Tax=Yinghuangia aomiensis TaxID=676205 RepID=A0ABP9HVD6_9ACTN